jgi:hypothetical protein
VQYMTPPAILEYDSESAIVPSSFMADSVFALNRSLGQRLLSLVHHQAGSAHPEIQSSGPLAVVITANEVNQQHGTGPLVKRICGGWSNVYSIRARNDFGGVQDFGDWNTCLHRRSSSRAEFFAQTLGILRGHTLSRILCVPFLRDEFLTAIALQKSFGAKLCAYIMDDQNIASSAIEDDLMREFLECCSLRLTTHPELQYAYESKYRLPFHLLPAIVPAHLIPDRPVEPPAETGRRGVLMGSFWDQNWFDRLTGVLSDCGCRIDWFGNNKSPWIRFDAKRLDSAGITAHGVIPEDRLVEELKKYPFVLVPAGALDGSEANPGVARLSLPGRILFAVATSHTPVLIVGNENTCGARFVRHFGVGEAAPYDAGKIVKAMDRISSPEQQRSMRGRAAEIGPLFSDAGVGEWLAKSIEQGTPADDRFVRLFSDYDRDIDLSDVMRATAAKA